MCFAFVRNVCRLIAGRVKKKRIVTRISPIVSRVRSNNNNICVSLCSNCRPKWPNDAAYLRWEYFDCFDVVRDLVVVSCFVARATQCRTIPLIWCINVVERVFALLQVHYALKRRFVYFIAKIQFFLFSALIRCGLATPPIFFVRKTCAQISNTINFLLLFTSARNICRDAKKFNGQFACGISVSNLALISLHVSVTFHWCVART